MLRCLHLFYSVYSLLTQAHLDEGFESSFYTLSPQEDNRKWQQPKNFKPLSSDQSWLESLILLLFIAH